MLATATRSARLALWNRYRQSLLAQTWEELCRRSVARLSTISPGTDWSPFEVVATSIDGGKLLVGEVKWSEKPATAEDLQSTYRNLISKGLPSGLTADGREIHDVMAALRY